MKPVRLVCAKAGSTLLALGVLVSSAIAGSGPCTTTPDCGHHRCGRSGHRAVACYVRISEEGSVATVTAQDSIGNGDVCVTPGTKIEWFTSDPSSNFTVTFAQNPFGHSPAASFSGTDGDAPQGGKVSHLPANACYQYSVTHSATGSSASLDPKVIVKGGSFLTSDAAKPKPMDNK
jgi:hypothetical protein